MSLEELMAVVETGATGMASTFAAYSFGLYRADMLVAVFFCVALTGQFLPLLLAKAR